MLINIDRQEAGVLREILSTQLKELKIESARADSHAFRANLHAREDVVEALLAKLADMPGLA